MLGKEGTTEQSTANEIKLENKTKFFDKMDAALLKSPNIGIVSKKSATWEVTASLPIAVIERSDLFLQLIQNSIQEGELCDEKAHGIRLSTLQPMPGGGYELHFEVEPLETLKSDKDEIGDETTRRAVYVFPLKGEIVNDPLCDHYNAQAMGMDLDLKAPPGSIVYGKFKAFKPLPDDASPLAVSITNAMDTLKAADPDAKRTLLSVETASATTSAATTPVVDGRSLSTPTNSSVQPARYRSPYCSPLGPKRAPLKGSPTSGVSPSLATLLVARSVVIEKVPVKPTASSDVSVPPTPTHRRGSSASEVFV